MSPALHADILIGLRYLMALVAVWALAAYLGRERFLSIWESEHELSLRLILSTAIVAFALYMRAANQLTTAESISYLEVALGMQALGTIKVTASRFAPKPTVDPTQQSKPDEPEQKT